MIRPSRARSGFLTTVLSASLALGFLGGCKSNEPMPKWIHTDVEAANDRTLIDVTAIALQKSGFPVGAGIDPGNLTVLSGWHTSLAPFRGQGWRERCEVRYVKKSPGHYEVAIHVRREKNDDLVHPLDIAYAVWIQEEDDVDRSRAVMQHLRSMLDPEVKVEEKP
jgi:hypothetical protein